MYAIVKAGGRQEKVAVGDTVIVDRIDAAAGATVSFPAVLVVDGAACLLYTLTLPTIYSV